MTTETIIKIILLVFVIFGIAGCFLLPKTKAVSRLAGRRDVMQRLYTVTGVTGAVTGITGLLSALLLGDRLFILHIWELILLPFALVHIWYYIIRKAGNAERDYDEKQMQDIAKAAGLAWAVMLWIMVLVFVQFQDRLTSSLIWFPVFLFGSILVYGAGMVVFNKR
ncbi:hypothetical protein JXO52_09890 [bacterium]|nr:hypothetical protein [bacterium]